MASNNELACVYASLILADDGVTITADKIQAVLKAAGVSVEPIWINLFAKALGDLDIKELVAKVGSSAGSAPAAAAPAAASGADAGAAESKKEEKKEESESEDDDMGFGKHWF
ncbi:DgyrCDS4770 [Dimorphilus gyrociliatus]|uniref:Large ribosomal subunit protein P1 n=1 Tax=Dimorphilus gyrociliatus TaxID=2664684 RepID=A0A7I8VI03_9ANNE|nr:DgyrCDS4770 [Dimorphilus gyrociliatus]